MNSNSTSLLRKLLTRGLLFLSLCGPTLLPAQEFVANIAQDNADAGIGEFQSNDDYLVFSASDGGPRALYYTDQSGETPRKFLVEFSSPTEEPSRAILLDDKLYVTTFDFGDNDGSPRLYVADLGNQTLTPLISGSQNGFTPQNFNGAATLGNRTLLYFGSRVIWSTDGTMAGTNVVTELQEGSFESAITGVDSLNYFLFGDFFTGSVVYRTDGTEEGTYSIIPDSLTGRAFRYFSITPFRNKSYFVVSSPGTPSRLFVTDGTVDGTKPFTGTSGRAPDGPQFSPQVVGDSLYFVESLRDSIIFLRTDDITIDTHRVISGFNGGRPYNFSIGRPYIFYNQADENRLVSLWRTDGTAAGTVRLKSYFNNPADQVNVGRERIRTADGGTLFRAEAAGKGEELFYASGTGDTAVLVRDIYPGPIGSNPEGLTTFGGQVYFTAVDGQAGRELWTAFDDGTGYVAQRVLDLNTIETGSSPGRFTVLNDKLIFEAGTSCTGREVFVSDGTAGGTQLLKDLAPGSESLGAFVPTQIGDELFFAADDGVSSSSVYRTDGTPAGTRKAFTFANGRVPFSPLAFRGKIIATGLTARTEFFGPVTVSYDPMTERIDTLLTYRSNGSFISGGGNSVVLNDSVLLFLTSIEDRLDLYATDGTAVGTRMIKSFAEDFPFRMRAANGIAYFGARDPDLGEELFRSDGTAEGTFAITDINPGLGDSRINSAYPAGDYIYFEASSGRFEPRFLYRTQGVRDDAELIRTASGLSFSANLFNSIVYDGDLFVAGITDDSKQDLWRVGREDGVAREVAAISDSRFGSQPRGFAVFRDTLYLTAETEATGRELYRTDGTAAGTVRLTDLNPGAGDGLDDELFVYANDLYFSGNDGLTGSELWRYGFSGELTNDDPNDVGAVCPAVTGVSGAPALIGFSAFPVPTAGQLTVTLPMVSDYGVEVTDLTGRTILTTRMSQTDVLDTRSLRDGLYLLRVRDELSGAVGVQKIVIRHR
ncbi:T9SS type A sorting domain-containing protein [Neolewinella antarctica]|uniref:ELWxxDGT repeat protein n=1 Tax=Neolewinella antarctica TaxID=442734 RepID=A0ABX0XHI7_9BACT|nr:T9SS type A sorting domain-containing protein [Neolewinella antarctica]NJC28311.1 ELWxxDGT repeat protein [Neolewinella antarctica]